ncbi:MAG: nitroreductase/quinone reductase family protein [Dehalococcoidia bacterium]
MNNDFNQQVIAEFRANGGKVGGAFEGRDMILLTTTGAKTGQQRTNPVVYRREGDDIYVFASMAGAPTSPAWYHNMVAHPRITVEVGTEKYEAIATPLDRAERVRGYAAQAADVANFLEYEV